MVDLAGGCDDMQDPGAPSLPLSWDQVGLHSLLIQSMIVSLLATLHLSPDLAMITRVFL